MLILFDIDLTLITTTGCGVRSFEGAGRALFGPGFTAEGVSYAGRLDPLIIGEMFARSGVRDTPEHRALLKEAYIKRLEGALGDAREARALPGVMELLATLRARRAGGADLALGVLTGNFEATGSMKLRRCGIDPEWFEVRVWGDDSPHDPPKRTHLVPVAMARYEVLRGRGVSPGRVVVVGDTPHDVEAARANGCRAVAVATGRSGREELASCGADLVLDDLRDGEGFLRFLGSCC